MERHFATVWESVADAMGDHTAIVQGPLRRSWAAFDDRAARLAAAFLDAGVQPGSKVALYLFNGPEYLETYFAALKVRAVPVNVNYRYLDDELLYLLENSEAEVLVFHASLGDRVARVAGRATGIHRWVEVDDLDVAGLAGQPPFDAVPGALGYEAVVAGHDPAPRIRRDPDDITMVYTGGTTGMPKGVMSPIGPGLDVIMSSSPPMIGEPPLTDPDDVATTARRFADAGNRIVALPACPLMHATGMTIGTIPGLTFGGTIVLLAHRTFDVDEVWAAVEQERVLSLTVVGDAFARPLLHGLEHGPDRDLSSLKVILSSGAMFSTEVKQGLLDRMPTTLVVDFIAATEAAMGMSIASKDHPAVTGRFLPGPGVKVFTEDEREVQAGSGESGFVAVPGATQTGYFHDQAKTDKTFRTIDGVRYAIPGDWAIVDTDGSLVLLGRGSQCINTGGEKVYPEEVEEAVKRHPAVEDCLVFGVPDERFGNRVVGVASLAVDADGRALAPADATEATAIVDSLRHQLSSYKLPRELVLVDAVPRAPNGKADYPSARALFEAARSSSGSRSQAAPVHKAPPLPKVSSMAPRFDISGLVVADMAASLAFYRLLGLDLPADGDTQPHVEIVTPAGTRLAWDTVDVIRSFDPGWTPASGGFRVSLGFACDTPAEVDATYAALVAAGHEGHLPPWDAFWGQRYATVHDPDGNAVDLFAPLPSS